MRKRHISALAGAAIAALATSVASVPAQATPVPTSDEPNHSAARPDDLPNPLGDAQRALTQDAVNKLVTGKATTEVRGGQRVIRLPGNDKAPKGSRAHKDRYVSYPVDREEDIFTILTDFGDKTLTQTGGTAGPVHNQIPKPDRNWDGNSTDDNSTNWSPNFDRQHYVDMMFGDGESFRNFYQKQSNGRFLAKGDVSNWVKLPYNEARYGSNKYSDSSTYWPYVRDTAQAWYDAQKAAGKSDQEITDYLKQFDKVDRYDYDGDGNFNEPDGYIDHFQAIHAGEGEEAGGGAQGEDAIWSHRWYAYSTDQGKTGPDFNKLGGVPLGNSGLWIGDYTTEPENGGLGVFTHEFGHDLGLPDYYDTNAGENSTSFWTLMSSGSWLNHGTDSIGTTPGYMGPKEKLQLGWLDYKTVPYGKDMTVKLGPADLPKHASDYQALAVTLPDKTVKTDYNTPHSGSNEWWGGSADNLNSTLTRTIDLTGKSSASISAWLQYNIEQDYDYLYAEASTDGGSTWQQVGSAITGPTGNAALTPWAQSSWDLTPYAGKSIKFRFRYATDGGLHYQGPFIDDVAVTADGAPIFSDDAESGDNGWTASGGFSRMSGSTSRSATHYYLAENRVYDGYDATLKTGPYNFGWSNTKPDWVERFPFQNGMLVWYVDGAYSDNNTSVHPGHGQSLPVDARPTPIVFSDGVQLSNRRQPFDATFGLEATDPVTFHRNGEAVSLPAQRAIPVFDDSDPKKYWNADNPQNSVQVAGSGTVMKVHKAADGGRELQVQVSFK